MNLLRNRKVAVVGGDGLVARSAHGLAIVHGRPDAVDALLADAPAHTAAGIELLCRMAAVGLPSGVTGVVVVTARDDGLEITTAGPEHVSVDGIEPAARRTGDAQVRVVDDPGVVRLGVALGHAAAASDLREGVVPGGGVVLSAAAQRDDDDAPPVPGETVGEDDQATAADRPHAPTDEPLVAVPLDLGGGRGRGAHLVTEGSHLVGDADDIPGGHLLGDAAGPRRVVDAELVDDAGAVVDGELVDDAEAIVDGELVDEGELLDDGELFDDGPYRRARPGRDRSHLAAGVTAFPDDAAHRDGVADALRGDAGAVIDAEWEPGPVRVGGDDTDPPWAAGADAGQVDASAAAPAIDPDPSGRAYADEAEIDPEPVGGGATQLTAILPPAQPGTTQIPPQPPVPVEHGAGPGTFELLDLRANGQHRPPLPTVAGTEAGTPHVVQGILCTREHFNSPLAQYCQVCGVAMAHAPRTLVERPRPTLGYIVFDDGMTFALDRAYTIGRELPEVNDPELTPLLIDDPEHSVSRRHAELRLEGWDVVVRDVGSSNGTRVWHEPTSSWQRLAPGEPLALRAGTYVAAGRRVFVYESALRS